MASRRRAYYDVGRFPEIAALAADHATFLAESRRVFDGLHDRLAALGSSYILPLLPEPEDSNEVSDQVFAQARALAPTTSGRVGAIPYVVSYAFSRVAPGAGIPEHDHWNPYLVALVCLQTGPGCYIAVGGERREFATGEIILFDYTLPHAVQNPSDTERVVLLCVIDPRKANRPGVFHGSQGTSSPG